MDFVDFLKVTARVYREEEIAIKEANPQAVNYLVGKIMQYTKENVSLNLH